MKKNLNLLPGARQQHVKMRDRFMRLADSDGFTILEVMVAVVILGLSYVSILQSFSLSMSNIHKVRRVRAEIFTESMQLAQSTKFTGDSNLNSDDEYEGESTLFMEGLKYQLMTITSESGEMATLRLEKVL